MLPRRSLALPVSNKRRIAFFLFCASTLTAAASGGPTFNRDVVPILQNRCQECHRPGEVAPMAFVTYQQTRPWAKAMREAVLLKKMPPWFAEPGYGPFANDAGEGGGYGSPKIVDRDFAMIAANGINAVRTYTVPPRWLLDIAWR